MIIGKLNARGFTEKSVTNIIEGSLPSDKSDDSTVDHIRTAFFGRNKAYYKWTLNFNAAYSRSKTPGNKSVARASAKDELYKSTNELDTPVLNGIFKAMANQFDNSKLESKIIQKKSLEHSVYRLDGARILRRNLLASDDYIGDIAGTYIRV